MQCASIFMTIIIHELTSKGRHFHPGDLKYAFPYPHMHGDKTAGGNVFWMSVWAAPSHPPRIRGKPNGLQTPSLGHSPDPKHGPVSHASWPWSMLSFWSRMFPTPSYTHHPLDLKTWAQVRWPRPSPVNVPGRRPSPLYRPAPPLQCISLRTGTIPSSY